MKFLKEYLFVKIYNMEYSFEKRKVRKEEKKKYERLKEALELLDEHHDTMINIMNRAEQNEEMEITSDEDVEDDDMEVDFMSIGEKRKGGGGRASSGL
jgi:precorrin-3B methylase